MSDTDLDLIEELDREATPGPWNSDPEFTLGAWPNKHQWRASAAVVAPSMGRAVIPLGVSHVDDAALIAHYRTACPELAREVRRLRARLASLSVLEQAALDLWRACDHGDEQFNADYHRHCERELRNAARAMGRAHDAQAKEQK